MHERLLFCSLIETKRLLLLSHARLSDKSWLQSDCIIKQTIVPLLQSLILKSQCMTFPSYNVSWNESQKAFMKEHRASLSFIWYFMSILVVEQRHDQCSKRSTGITAVYAISSLYFFCVRRSTCGMNLALFTRPGILSQESETRLFSARYFPEEETEIFCSCLHCLVASHTNTTLKHRKGRFHHSACLCHLEISKHSVSPLGFVRRGSDVVHTATVKSHYMVIPLSLDINFTYSL